MNSEQTKENAARNFIIFLLFWLNLVTALFNVFRLAVIFGYSTSKYAMNASVAIIAAQIAAPVLISIIYIPMMKRHRINWKFWR